MNPDEALIAELIQRTRLSLATEVARLRAVIEALSTQRAQIVEECASTAEQMPGRILCFYDRPGGPPGNQYRPTTLADIAGAIRALKEPSS